MQVKDIMSSHLITVDREETVAAAARLLSRHNVGALPVTAQGGKLVGMLTDRDITVRCVAANFDPNVTRVRTVMSAGAVTVPAEESEIRAARTMGKHRVRRLPVTQNGKLVGMLSQGDFAACAEQSGDTAKAFREVFEAGPKDD
ncbi:MAG: CBS domain-containing protein [Oscillospiraceae bacterium]|nr:CBS domain-containing protein [Oscillospiraceae bacterium]MBR7009854.1 CBS domain-containing protein [Oscillospiraceae bacterium]